MPKITFKRTCRGNVHGYIGDRPITHIRRIDKEIWWCQTKGKSGHHDTLREAKAWVREQWGDHQ